MRLSSRSLKKLPDQLALVQHQHPQAQAELWAMDEHRIGLKPILRRIWAPKGATVKAPVAQRYEWMYVCAFVHPQSGRTSWLLLPTVNVEVFSLALAAFAAEVGAGPDKHIVLVLDRAGWHSSARLTVPEGIYLLFLPPYSPEVQPAERLWPLSNEPVANRVFTSLDELEEVQAERCRWLQVHPEIVQSYTCFHWWPFLVDST
jgi:DDE superfamily endonuclease